MSRETPAQGAELYERLALVESLIIKGLSKAEVVRYIRTECQAWDITDRHARRYYDRVMERMSKQAVGIDRAAYFMRSLQRLDYLYQAAMKVMDFKTAHSVTLSFIKLLRLDDPSYELDWRKAAENAGLNASELFEKAIAAIAASDQSKPDAG